MRIASLRNTRDAEKIPRVHCGVEEENSTVNDRAKSKGEKDRTWLQQLMPGEPLGVTRPVTSYLDTFSLAPPPPLPSTISSPSVCLPSFVLRALVASPRLVVRKVHLPASIKGNPACFSVSPSRLVSSLVVSSSPLTFSSCRPVFLRPELSSVRISSASCRWGIFRRRSPLARETVSICV